MMRFSPWQSGVFAQPLGADFPLSVVVGLQQRMQDSAPDDIAKITLIVNTARMARRIRELFVANGPSFLPRIVLLDQLDSLIAGTQILPARPPLQRRLQLSQLIAPALDAKPELGAKSSVFALSDSLASLMDEMQSEGVGIDAIRNLDVTDQSGHWENAKALIGIAHDYVSQIGAAPDKDARQRTVIDTLISKWASEPPQYPIILAGSTGSRGATFDLMCALAKQRYGTVILPGMDADLPREVWQKLSDPLIGEDHPQFRFAKLFRALDLDPKEVPCWDPTPIGTADRNKVFSLSLRPAPVTDSWLREGPDLPDLCCAMQGVTFLEADTQRVEALCIAMRLRAAAESGQTAALITPDRMLTRQVTSALDQWNIVPDDSAGTPLHLSPPGRFLRHVAELFLRPLDAELLLVLLKHPLTQSGEAAPYHGLFRQELELALRRDRVPCPNADRLHKLASKITASTISTEVTEAWVRWLCATFPDRDITGAHPLAHWINTLQALAELIAGGEEGNSGGLWEKAAGRMALAAISSIHDHSGDAGIINAREFSELLYGVLSEGEVRDRDEPHPDIMIWGTMEARVQGADLVILGGLNDGIWPGAHTADPWMNRTMRNKVGLLLPDRRIGLAAHDFQQAASAPEVWLTRALRSEDAETVPSRWINRLVNLVSGLPKQGGHDALDAMRLRGNAWIARVKQFEDVAAQNPAKRAAPKPPVETRPRDFSVTEIKTLIRDPYAIYARKVLKLRKLDPLVQEPNAQIRGILFHEIMERFVDVVSKDQSRLTRDDLLAVTDSVLGETATWLAERSLWRAHLERIANWIIETEKARRQQGLPFALERDAKAVLELSQVSGTITARADRIDLAEDGAAILYDYKTGTPPTPKQQTHFDKQLLIEAAMIEEGAFSSLGPRAIKSAAYIGLGNSPKIVEAPLTKNPPDVVLQGLTELIRAYLDAQQHFLSRRMLQSEQEVGDFDHLARHGEWDDADEPHPQVLI